MSWLHHVPRVAKPCVNRFGVSLVHASCLLFWYCCGTVHIVPTVCSHCSVVMSSDICCVVLYIDIINLWVKGAMLITRCSRSVMKGAGVEHWTDILIFFPSTFAYYIKENIMAMVVSQSCIEISFRIPSSFAAYLAWKWTVQTYFGKEIILFTLLWLSLLLFDVYTNYWKDTLINFMCVGMLCIILPVVHI